MTESRGNQAFLWRWCQGVWHSWLGAIAFYTCLPIPHHWPLSFVGIARWAPLVGVGLGAGVAVMDWGLAWVQVPLLVRSAIAVVLWLGITGGLHLDGAMDTADGLAVLDPQRRLAVMADSHTGAFGVMAAVVILLLKVTALASIAEGREWALMVAAGWGRWGQLVAIARYPYLKPTGKGAFHKEAITSLWAVVPALMLLLGVCAGAIASSPTRLLTGAIALSGGAIAILTGAWFNRQLGGQTGDTYGAIVEWTEALVLCCFAIGQ